MVFIYIEIFFVNIYHAFAGALVRMLTRPRRTEELHLS